MGYACFKHNPHAVGTHNKQKAATSHKKQVISSVASSGSQSCEGAPAKPDLAAQELSQGIVSDEQFEFDKPSLRTEHDELMDEPSRQAKEQVSALSSDALQELSNVGIEKPTVTLVTAAVEQAANTTCSAQWRTTAEGSSVPIDLTTSVPQK